jgi:two-component system, OmpR family, KDP operon response regulator KdpE
MYTMTAAMHLVLIVEDDTALQSVLRTLFEASGYRVVSTVIAAGGIRDARLHNPDIAIVDLGLPDRDGIEVIKGIRTWSAMPIVVLTARTAEAQRLLAFESGADDYIVKPFSAPELLARVRAVSRRHVRGDLPMGILRLGDISVDLTGRIASRADGREVRLTPLEHRILAVLARHPESIVTHSTLLKEVWGPNRDDSGSLRVYIGSLRRKLEADPSRPTYIITELGLGYRLLLDQEVREDRSIE